MKKFYKVGEKIWIKPLKRTGIIKEILKETLEANIVINKVKGDESDFEYTQIFKLWEVDKYKKPKNILVKYFDQSLPKLEAIKVGNWVDVRSAVDITLKQFEFKLIPLGFAMQLPEGYEANVVPRSSTYKNFGIIQTNHFAVIDESYSGNEDQWHFPALALRDTEIKKGDRIAQFRINKIMPKIKFIEVEELQNENRGGIGSTGVQ